MVQRVRRKRGMALIPSQCRSCKHLDREKPRSKRCAAFPDGIPMEICATRRAHREPYPGDGGIVYEPIPGGVHPMRPANRQPLIP